MNLHTLTMRGFQNLTRTQYDAFMTEYHRNRDYEPQGILSEIWVDEEEEMVVGRWTFKDSQYDLYRHFIIRCSEYDNEDNRESLRETGQLADETFEPVSWYLYESHITDERYD